MIRKVDLRTHPQITQITQIHSQDNTDREAFRQTLRVFKRYLVVI
jgi:hypothetical protein